MIGSFLKMLEIKKLQRNCPHDFHIVHSTKYYTRPNEYDLYCPLCDKLELELNERQKDLIFNMQKVKHNYLEGKIKLYDT